MAQSLLSQHSIFLQSQAHTTFPLTCGCMVPPGFLGSPLWALPFLFIALRSTEETHLWSSTVLWWDFILFHCILFCGGTLIAQQWSGRIRQHSIRSSYFENTLRFFMLLYDAEGAFLWIFYFIKFKQNCGGKCWPAHHRTGLFVTDKGFRTHHGSGLHVCPGGQHATICDSVILSFLWLSLTWSKNQ